MDPQLVQDLPIESVISIISQLSNVKEIENMCNSTKRLKKICSDENNWTEIVRLILIKIGFDIEDIKKITSNKLKTEKIYSIIVKTNPHFNDESHFEMLAYSVIQGDNDIVEFFKKYFFLGDSSSVFKKEDIKTLKKLIRNYLGGIENKDTLKITDVTGKSYTLCKSSSSMQKGGNNDINIHKILSQNVQFMPTELVINMIKTLDSDSINNLCMSNNFFVNFCKSNWNTIVRHVLLNAGFKEI